jgi:predicted RNase H-like HicB family nuclease
MKDLWHCDRAEIHLLHMGNKAILRTDGSKQEGLMSYLQQTIKAVIRPGDEAGYVAECLEIAVVTQGRTLDETVKHLQEATALHLEGESLESFGLRDKPTLVLTMELDPVHAQAS